MLRRIEVNSSGEGVYDITPQLEKLVEESGVRDGLLLVYAASDLCSIITLEYESRLLLDLKRLIDGLPVADRRVKSSIFPISQVFPIAGSCLELGSFKQVCMLDLSGKPGKKEVVAMVIK